MKLTSLSLPVAAALVLGAGLAAAEEATDAQVRNVDVRKIVIGQGDSDAPKTGVFVSRVQKNGEQPVTSLQVLGSDSQAIELDDLLDGDTRSYDIGEGKWMDVRRDGDLLRIDLDGKEIEVPLDPGADAMFGDLHGAHGTKTVEVMMLTGDELDGHDGQPHRMVFMSEDGRVQDGASDGGFSWTEEGNLAVGSRVLVKRVGAGGADDEDVHVLAMPAFPIDGLVGQEPDFSNLKALEGADPEVRERVIAALKEILGQHHAIQFNVEVDDQATADAKTEVRVRRAAPVTHAEIR